MNIRRLLLTAGFVVIAAGAVLAVIREEPGSGIIAFLGTLALVAGAVALLFRRRSARASAFVPDPFGGDVASTDVINFSRLRVAGLGGIGLIAMCVAIAIALPRIGQTMMLAAVGGSLVAFAVIRYRRGRGPLDSSHAEPGARSVLVERDEPASSPDALPRADRRERRAVAAPIA